MGMDKDVIAKIAGERTRGEMYRQVMVPDRLAVIRGNVQMARRSECYSLAPESYAAHYVEDVEYLLARVDELERQLHLAAMGELQFKPATWRAADKAGGRHE